MTRSFRPWDGNPSDLCCKPSIAQARRCAVRCSATPSVLPTPLILSLIHICGDVGLSEYLDKAAGERIARALTKAKGNRAEAARSLGIGRATLYRFMRRLGNESVAERRAHEPGEQQ